MEVSGDVGIAGALAFLVVREIFAYLRAQRANGIARIEESIRYNPGGPRKDHLCYLD